MAKLPEYYPKESWCTLHDVVTNTRQMSNSVQKRRPNGAAYWTTEYGYEHSCGCESFRHFLKVDNTPKEPTVAKTFDTSADKNTALQAIQQRVEEIERALYNKSHALSKVENEHNKLIADASNALTNALAQSLQAGIVEEDLEIHLPDYDAELSDRLNDVRNIMSLANVLDGV